MDSSALRELCLGTLVIEAAIGGFALAVACFSRRPLGERLGLARGRSSARDYAVLVVGMLALSFALDGAIEWWGLRAGTPLEEFAQRLGGARGADFALAMLAIGLAPGIAEELLCRGLVQRGLEPRLGAAGAIGIGAVFFGALHADWVHGSFAVPLGLYLGVAAAMAGSIWPAIVCHASNNLLAVYLAAFWPALQPPGPLGVVLAGALALTCLWLGCRPGAEPSALQIAAGSDDL